MATKKKTAKTEDVAVELKPVEESVEQKDVQAVDKAVDAVEEPAPARSVQDHVTVVIPYCKEFAQGKELLFALRSWQKNVRFGMKIGSAKRLPSLSTIASLTMHRLIRWPS